MTTRLLMPVLSMPRVSLTMLYEHCNENNSYDNERIIKATDRNISGLCLCLYADGRFVPVDLLLQMLCGGSAILTVVCNGNRLPRDDGTVLVVD